MRQLERQQCLLLTRYSGFSSVKPASQRHTVFLILRDFDYLPSFFSVSETSRDKAKLFQVAPGLLSGCRLDCPILFYVSTRFREFQVKAAVLALIDFKHGGMDSIKVVKHEGQSVRASS